MRKLGADEVCDLGLHESISLVRWKAVRATPGRHPFLFLEALFDLIIRCDQVIDDQVQAPVHQYLATRCYSSHFNVVNDSFGGHDLYTPLRQQPLQRRERQFWWSRSVHPTAQTTSSHGSPSSPLALLLRSIPSPACSLMLKNTWWPHALGGGAARLCLR